MAAEFLRTETFEAWASHFDKRLDEALSLRAELTHTATSLRSELTGTQQAVAVLQDRSENTRRLAFSSLIGSAVSACFMYLLGHRP